MITLEKFYYVFGPNTEFTLKNSRTQETVYVGGVDGIPAEYNECEVTDLMVYPDMNATLVIKIKEPPRDRSWHEGCTRVGKAIYHFWVKTADKNSEYGIDGGKVIKAMLRRNGEIVCNYDRGWVVMPADSETETALAIAIESAKEGK